MTPQDLPAFPPGSPPLDLDPPSLLQVVTRRIARKAALRYPIEEAPPGFLAEEVESVPHGWTGVTGPPARVALRNGYAIPPGMESGTVCRVLGTLSPAGGRDVEGRERSETDMPVETEGPEPRIWRVETGAELPAGVAGIAEVAAATIVGTELVRMDALPAPGEGIVSPVAAGEAIAAAPRFPPGTSLDGRLRALLQARGATTVALRPPFAVGFATVGDELTDPAAPPASGQRHDLLALPVEGQISRLGLGAVPCGILGDVPGRLRGVLLRARERRVEVMLLSGGMGDGVTDRTVEALRSLDADVVVDARVVGCGGFVLARALGIEILAITGRPLQSAAQLDLFVLPALLARWGAGRERWDWSRFSFCLEEPLPPAAATSRLLPARRVPSAAGGMLLRVWEPETPFSPTAAGQEGWAVLPPPPNGPGGERLAYFCPTSA